LQINPQHKYREPLCHGGAQQGDLRPSNSHPQWQPPARGRVPRLCAAVLPAMLRVPCHPHPPTPHLGAGRGPWVCLGAEVGAPGSAFWVLCHRQHGDPAWHGTGGSADMGRAVLSRGTVGCPQAQEQCLGQLRLHSPMLGCQGAGPGPARCLLQHQDAQRHTHRYWHTCTSRVYPCHYGHACCAPTHTLRQALPSSSCYGHTYPGTFHIPWHTPHTLAHSHTHMHSGVVTMLPWGTLQGRGGL